MFGGGVKNHKTLVNLELSFIHCWYGLCRKVAEVESFKSWLVVNEHVLY